MLTASIGYGIGINWDEDDFPTGLFDDLNQQAQKELIEDHIEDEGKLPENHTHGTHISAYFDNCAAYACLYARIITGFPLLEAYTAGFYNDDSNPCVVIYLPSTRKSTSGGKVSMISDTQGTPEELAQLEEFCRIYFPDKTPASIFWAELS